MNHSDFLRKRIAFEQKKRQDAEECVGVQQKTLDELRNAFTKVVNITFKSIHLRQVCTDRLEDLQKQITEAEKVIAALKICNVHEDTDGAILVFPLSWKRLHNALQQYEKEYGQKK